MKKLIYISFLLLTFVTFGQTSLKGKVTSLGIPLELANVSLSKTNLRAATDSLGNYYINKIPKG
ncbi:MAG TPA: hypothetical protein VLB74_10335, partial [Flavobacterium sp.]|uniref:hypothetical protein n=1 Tax=Flavobacterium sp. TaxID=239 RepID=UPI002C9DAFCC